MTRSTGEALPTSADVAVTDEEYADDNTPVHHHVLDLTHTAMPASIHMENSSDVHIGPRMHYNAPVSITQYVNVVKGSDEDTTEDTHVQHGVGQGLELTAAKSPTSRWRQFYWGIVLVLIVGIVVVGISLYFTTESKLFVSSSASESGKTGHYTTVTPPPDATPDPNITLSDGNYIYSRDSWVQYPPKFTIKLPHPTPYVIIAHTVGPSCLEPISCNVLLMNMYSDHVGTYEQPDIGYNFIIDSSGNVYEGRGWDRTNFISGYTKRRNILIAFFGNYVIDDFNEKQIKSLKELLDLGLRLGKLSTDYMLLAHKQVFNSLSPGNNILKEIDTWRPHRCLENCEIPYDTTTTSTSITEKSQISTTISSK